MIVYAITDPSTFHFKTLKENIAHILTLASMVVYRDKSTDNYEINAKLFLEEAKAQTFDKVLLHTDYFLAKKLGADGVHLGSTQCEDIMKAKALGLFVVISTHTKEEAMKAESKGADMITFSPVFDTPNKGMAVGIDSLRDMVASLRVPVIALGGILTQKQIASCESAGAKGFASIRYFERKVLS